MPMPKTCLVRMWSTRSSRSGISSASPSTRRVVISRRNTPDLVNGSRNVTSMVGPDARAVVVGVPTRRARRSSIWFANSGGVKTSSFDRLAMHVSTSGLRLRRLKATCSRHRCTAGDLGDRQGTVVPSRREDLVLAEVGEQGVFLCRTMTSESWCRSGSRGGGTAPCRGRPTRRRRSVPVAPCTSSSTSASPCTMFTASTCWPLQ